MTNTIESLYQVQRQSGRMMAHHMPALRSLAESCDIAVEFGIRQGPSTLALLASGCPVVHSYDVEYIPQWHDPIKAAANGRWYPHYESSYKAKPFSCELLMHDSFHNYSQVAAELGVWAGFVKRFLVFHDSISCAIVGQGIDGGHTDPLHKDKRGIRLAIDELMIRDDSWRIYSHDPESAGLLVLERR